MRKDFGLIIICRKTLNEIPILSKFKKPARFQGRQEIVGQCCSPKFCNASVDNVHEPAESL
jgi:hypothetical protein